MIIHCSMHIMVILSYFNGERDYWCFITLLHKVSCYNIHWVDTSGTNYITIYYMLGLSGVSQSLVMVFYLSLIVTHQIIVPSYITPFIYSDV